MLLLALMAALAQPLEVREQQAILAAVEVYRTDQEGAPAVISDRTITTSFLPRPGSMDGLDRLPDGLLNQLIDRNVSAAPVEGLCADAPTCTVLTPTIQDKFRRHGEQVRKQALDTGEPLPRGFNPFWDAFGREFPDAVGLLRVSRPAFSDDGALALVAIIWTGPNRQGGSQVILLEDNGWGWLIKDVVIGDLAL